MPARSLLKKHPINIDDVFVKDLHIEGLIHPSEVKDEQEIDYSIKIGHTDYSTEEKFIVVGLILEVAENEKEKYHPPYNLKVEIVAKFNVDEDRFPVEQINDWAGRNAPMILYPYLREHVYALTLRCGYPPLNLDLIEVPTFEIKKVKKKPVKTKKKK